MGYPSLYRLYMEEADPTEYRFATKYLDGWSHWEELSVAPWFKDYVEAWRRELEVKLRSDSLRRIKAVSEDKEDSNSYHANKYLLEANWKTKEEGKRGRPSKAALKQEIKNQAQEYAQIEKDAERLGVMN